MALEVSDGDLGSCASEKPRTLWRGWWWKHRWIGDSEQFRKDRGRLGGKKVYHLRKQTRFCEQMAPRSLTSKVLLVFEVETRGILLGPGRRVAPLCMVAEDR